MARLNILEYPDPRLRLAAEPVTAFGPELATFVDDLFETLYATGGIGLSATQVADRRSVLVMDLSGDGSAPRMFVNAEILSSASPAWVEESCLSLPGVVGNVVRSTRIRVRARNLNGDRFEEDLSDMYAVCMQHELDHLEGRLFIDRLPLLSRLRIRLARTDRRHRRAAARA